MVTGLALQSLAVSRTGVWGLSERGAVFRE